MRFGRIAFVEKQHEQDDVYTFRFATGRPLRYRAGQHGIFIIPGLARPHPFSFSSAPEEPLLSFTTRLRSGSRFKQYLARLQPGARILLAGPLMNFTLEEAAERHVLLAQGIGITPFRSMLQHANTTTPSLHTTLIHVQKEPHLFAEQTRRSANQALYPTGRTEFQQILNDQDKASMFYISGNPRFIADTKKALQSIGVTAKRIKTDSFWGY